MRISEVSLKTSLSSDTLRYYEKIGLLPSIKRLDNGIRDYDEQDLHRIMFIKHMRLAGLPIEVLLEYFDLVKQGDYTIQKRKGILTEQRENLLARMEELEKTLDILDYKISWYEEAMIKAEQELGLLQEEPVLH